MAGLISWGEDTLPADAPDHGCEDEDPSTKEDFETFKAWLCQQPATVPAICAGGAQDLEVESTATAATVSMGEVTSGVAMISPASGLNAVAFSTSAPTVAAPEPCPLCSGVQGGCNLVWGPRAPSFQYTLNVCFWNFHMRVRNVAAMQYSGKCLAQLEIMKAQIALKKKQIGEPGAQIKGSTFISACMLDPS